MPSRHQNSSLMLPQRCKSQRHSTVTERKTHSNSEGSQHVLSMGSYPIGTRLSPSDYTRTMGDCSVGSRLFAGSCPALLAGHSHVLMTNSLWSPNQHSSTLPGAGAIGTYCSWPGSGNSPT